MTTCQQKAVERIKRDAEGNLFYSRDGYEFKRFEVEENEYFVSVLVEVGSKGDEGTLAEVFGRDRAHFFVGKRGGITFPVWDEKKGKMFTRQYSEHTMLGVVIAQA